MLGGTRCWTCRRTPRQSGWRSHGRCCREHTILSSLWMGAGWQTMTTPHTWCESRTTAYSIQHSRSAIKSCVSCTKQLAPLLLSSRMQQWLALCADGAVLLSLPLQDGNNINNTMTVLPRDAHDNSIRERLLAPTGKTVPCQQVLCCMSEGCSKAGCIE